MAVQNDSQYPVLTTLINDIKDIKDEGLTILGNETNRVNAENTRIANETNRVNAEQARQDGYAGINTRVDTVENSLTLTNSQLNDMTTQISDVSNRLTPVSKNLFNKDAVQSNKYVDFSDGIIRTLTNYTASDYMAVKPSTKYALTISGSSGTDCAFYDTNKTYISGLANASTGIQTPANCAYIVVTTPIASIGSQQLELGTQKTSYSAFVNTSFQFALTEDQLNIKPIIKKIKKDGTGDFTNIPAALAAITDNSYQKPYLLQIYEGTYTEANWTMKDYISLEGVDRDKCIIYTELAASATNTEISNNVCFNWATTGSIKNLTVKCKNSRYPIHAESNGVNVDRTQCIYNCIIEHLGNKEVYDYRVANSQSTSGIWNPTAWGCGTSSGVVIKAYHTTFKAGNYAFYFHNNVSFSRPNYIELNNCRCIDYDGTAASIGVTAMGSNSDDILVINNCECNARIDYTDSPWLYGTIDYQPSNNTEIKIFGAGNTSMAFNSMCNSRALRIKSLTETSSKVRVSGTASSILFGTPINYDGCLGINGFSYGDVNVAEVGVGSAGTTYITALGKRLGDCTSVNKTLTVTIDALAAVNIVFNADYTNVTNDTILTTINTALSGKGTADFMDVVKETYYPYFQNEEINLINTSTEGIKKGMAVTYNTNCRNIRKMANTDLATDFVGIALENIKPNEMGRIKIKGKLYVSQIALNTNTTASFKDTYGISAVSGLFDKGTALKLLKCIDNNILEF